MSNRQFVVIANDKFRQKACDMVRAAPKETVVEFRKPTRTTEQNRRLWAMLGCISEQVEHGGCKLSPEDWKTVFMHALNGELRMTPSLDGKTLLPLGYRSSQLTIPQMIDLQTIMEEFSARKGVVFSWEGE